MNNRILFLVFDLPTLERDEKSAYRKFVKHLLCDGYFRLQNSVFIKLIRSYKTYNSEVERLRKNSPKRGSVIVFMISYEVYCNGTTILGGEMITPDINEKIIEMD